MLSCLMPAALPNYLNSPPSIKCMVYYITRFHIHVSTMRAWTGLAALLRRLRACGVKYVWELAFPELVQPVTDAHTTYARSAVPSGVTF